jgi:hypothetical protein
LPRSNTLALFALAAGCAMAPRPISHLMDGYVAKATREQCEALGTSLYLAREGTREIALDPLRFARSLDATIAELDATVAWLKARNDLEGFEIFAQEAHSRVVADYGADAEIFDFGGHAARSGESSEMTWAVLALGNHLDDRRTRLNHALADLEEEPLIRYACEIKSSLGAAGIALTDASIELVLQHLAGIEHAQGQWALALTLVAQRSSDASGP